MIADAVILAAGKGTRIRASADDPPKPLRLVAGVPLIKRTILTLARASISRAVVVTGFMADQVRATLDGDPSYAAAGITVELVHNEHFDRSNGISVALGGRHVGGPFVLSMADHIYSPAIARLLAAQDLGAADLYLATDPRIDNVLDLDDATKVRTDAGRIVDIGKTLEHYDRIDCGVFAVAPRLVEILDELWRTRGDCSLSDGVRQLGQLGRARIADIGDELWQDVDTPADAARAEQLLRERDPLS